MRDWIARSLRALLKRLCDTVEVDGLRVMASHDGTLAKVRDALSLIKARDPLRYARITRDLKAVWVTLLPGSIAQFTSTDFICELDPRFVATSTPERIASVIVHEATHARLERRGVGYSEDIRKRVEQVCLRRELAFAARLPDTDVTREELTVLLDLPTAFWSDKVMSRSHLHGMVEMGKHAGLPRWLLVRALKKRRSLERRRRAAVTASNENAPPCERSV